MKIDNVESFVEKEEQNLSEKFKQLNDIAFINQKKVLKAFQKNEIAARHMVQSSGYGYDDVGRDGLNRLFSDIFHTEDSIVSPLIMSGTHAIALCLYGILRPNDKLLSIVGDPYDTLKDVITGKECGSLADFGIEYQKIELIDNGLFDLKSIEKALGEKFIKLIFIGRSRGYSWRNSISIEQIKDVCKFIKNISPQTMIMTDNCYGEFTEVDEPTDVGVDIIAGSLIKNPGGGIAPTGGYVAGKKHLIDLVANRFTCPSVGKEIGSYSAGYTAFYQGIFLAPHVVNNCLKGCLLASSLFRKMGYDTLPLPNNTLSDIITSIQFNTKEELISFCRSIQRNSPIDSNVTPYPWDMPGYAHQVIMAAGTFVQGASIELSADSPIKEPYIAYMQGGLTYEHIKLALIETIKDIQNLH